MMQTFTAYRRNLAARGTHTEAQRNADNEPQFEGVIWTDGTCTLRWRTQMKSTSVFASFSEMAAIHGHPEYGTEIYFHNGPAPNSWLDTLFDYGAQLAHDNGGVLQVTRDPHQRVTGIWVNMPDGTRRVLFTTTGDNPHAWTA